MDRIPLKAQEREILGKKVRHLRKEGLLPAHVFGKGLTTEHVSVKMNDFLKVYAQTGETGLIDLKIGDEKVRPVMVRDLQIDPLKRTPLHVDFYQVNLNVAVQVTVPIELVGEEPEIVHSGEAVVIQPLGEVEVEALPGHIPERIQVDISILKQIDDTIFVSDLTKLVSSEVTILTDPEAVVAKLDTAVSEETEELMEEMEAAEAAAEGIEEGAESEEAEEGTSEQGGKEPEKAEE